MTYLFNVQDYTSYNFSAGEIAELIFFGQNTPNANELIGGNCLDKDYRVNDPDTIMNEAFRIAGHPELTATAGWGAEKNQSPTYTNISVLTDLGNEHRVAGDKDGNIIYNPWKGGLVTEINSILYIFVHGDMKK